MDTKVGCPAYVDRSSQSQRFLFGFSPLKKSLLIVLGSKLYLVETKDKDDPNNQVGYTVFYSSTELKTEIG